jgi:hypothetical protein
MYLDPTPTWQHYCQPKSRVVLASAISWRPTPPSPTARPKKLAYAFSSNAVSSDGDPVC